MRTRQSIFRCGYLLPRMLVLWLVVDFCLRLAPEHWRFVHAREFLAQPGSNQMGPFMGDQTYKDAFAYGDLAALGNCAECRDYRPLLVHMDSRGFPNPPASSPYNAILVGDSFAVGAQQLPDSTLAAQLSTATGLSIYNASCSGHILGRELVLRLINDLGLTHGTVFFELMDRSASIRGEALEQESFSTLEDAPPVRSLYRLFQIAQQSSLQNLSRETVGRMYDGSFLPNPYAARVIRKNMPDGKPILFYPEDAQDGASGTPKLWSEYFRSLNKELWQRNFRLVVILVPSKYTVYQPFLKDAVETNKSRQFEELKADLRDLTVVNTTPAMKKAAADALANGELLYWRDDTHWNSDGVRVAVAEVEKSLPSPRHNSAVPKLRQVSRGTVR